jgi:hypothetical protein
VEKRYFKIGRSVLKARARPRPLEIMNARSVSQRFELLPEIKQRPLEEYSGLFKESSDAR